VAAPRVWLFDLDNTLHNASHAAFRMIDRSMTEYIERELALSREEADRLRRHYWQRYGATLIGLLRHHGARGPHFLEQTHRLPGLEQQVHGHPHDFAAIRRLPGRRYVLTNAPREYTERVLRTLGVAHLFDGVIAIEQMRMFGHWRPKPDTRMFRHLLARLRTPAGQCVLVEDALENQKAARALGMRTVWMQRWLKHNQQAPKVGVYLHRRPVYVCARIRSLQHLHKRLR
jgi:putative hydrolase of the HAD superfamily